eukprot:1161844-Pelagomonas_calceolata.AAC.8
MCADFNRVFEVEPLFRRGIKQLYGHLRWPQLDARSRVFEVRKAWYALIWRGAVWYDWLDMGLRADNAKDMAVVAEQYPFEKAVFKRLRLTFAEAIKILQENGYPDVSPPGGVCA